MIDFVLEYGSSTKFLYLIPEQYELHQKLTRRIRTVPKMEKKTKFFAGDGVPILYLLLPMSVLFTIPQLLSATSYFTLVVGGHSSSRVAFPSHRNPQIFEIYKYICQRCLRKFKKFSKISFLKLTNLLIFLQLMK